MRLSDGLKTKRADLLERLKALSDKAGGEGRELDASETAAWDAGMKEARDLDARIQREEQAEQMRREQPQRHAIDSEGRQHLIMRAGDALAARYPSRHDQPLDLAKAVRGIVTGNWDGADGEKRAMGEGALASGGFSVPQELSSQWLDMARSKAVCVAAGGGTIPMQSQTLRIAEIVGDVAPVFRPEHVALPENDVVFGACDLRARLVGVVARASLELISDSPMASDMIVASITGALGVAMDKAMLSGDGVTNASVDNPTGILVKAGVNAIPIATTLTDYDHHLDAIVAIENANGNPTAVIDNPTDANELRKLKTGLTGDLTKLMPPPRYSQLAQYVTTGLSVGNSIVGDFTQALFGLRESVVIEATRVGSDALSKADVLIRGFMRLDVGILRPAHFSKITGIALAAAAAGAPTRRAA